MELKIIKSVFILLISFFLTIVVSKFFRIPKSSLTDKRKTILIFIKQVINVAIYFLGTLYILDMFGVNIAPFLLSSSIIGFAVGFGAQSLIKDMLAGVSLLLEPEFRIGSLVEINKEIGEVKKVSLKNTYLLTKKNELVIIPNGLITVIKILK